MVGNQGRLAMKVLLVMVTNLLKTSWQDEPTMVLLYKCCSLLSTVIGHCWFIIVVRDRLLSHSIRFDENARSTQVGINPKTLATTQQHMLRSLAPFLSTLDRAKSPAFVCVKYEEVSADSGLSSSNSSSSKIHSERKPAGTQPFRVSEIHHLDCSSR